MAKRQTNVQFLTQLMEYSNFGAMSQVFIMDAIQKHAKHVSSIPLDDLRKQFGESMVSADSWHGVAIEIKDKFEEHYKS
jgi:hypothetical protein